ncbi:MAG TPA: TolC family protein [Anaeromyxobacter sp.]
MTPALLALLAAAAGPRTLTLDEALARARSHPQISAARAAVEGASARAAEARAGFLPSAAATADATAATDNAIPARASDPRPNVSDVLHPSLTATLTLSQPIWDFGRTLGTFRSARLSERAAEADLAAAVDETAFEVRTAYYGALAAEALLVAADETVRQMQKHVSFAEESFAVGRRTRFDVTRARVELASARIARIQALNGVALARAALSAAIGEPIADAVLAPAEERPDDPLPDRAIAEALARRPELAALDRRIAAQLELVGAAKATFLPVLGASGQVAWSAPDVPLVRNWQAGVTLTWPILAGGADRARWREQEAAARALRAARDALALRIREEAEQSALAIIEARARRAAADVLLSQAQENLGLAEGRYQQGVGNIIELTDAQAALTAGRAQAVRAGYDVAIARARLRRALAAPL